MSTNSMSIRDTIISQFRQVAEEHNRKLVPLRDDLLLLESGLDSLSFAVIVSRLEDVLDVDPFTQSEAAPFPTTLGEFIGIYEGAAKE